MSVVTYFIRALPLTLIRKEITNTYLKSFLHYVPYATLTAMTFPAVMYSTASHISGITGFIIAVFLAYRSKGLLTVAISACVVVYLIESILKF